MIESVLLGRLSLLLQDTRIKKGTAIVAVMLVCTSGTTGDTFGTGANQFTIDFVPISGDARSANGTRIGTSKTFVDPGSDYRMGVFEITSGPWNKFQASLGMPVTGSPSTAYDASPDWTGTNVPTNNVSWYGAAQFVKDLNASTGHQAAYKFDGTRGNRWRKRAKTPEQ
jgi:hypothetical protein